MSILALLAPYLGVFGGVFLIAGSVAMYLNGEVHKDAGDREALLNDLENDSLRAAYRDRLKRGLDRLDAAFGAWEARGRDLDGADAAAARARNARPWSWGLLDAALLAALLYPLASLLLFWTLLPGPGTLGTLPILPDIARWERVATLVGVAVTLLLVRLVLSGAARLRLTEGFVAVGLGESAAGQLAVAFAIAGAGAVAGAFAGAGAGAVAVAVAVALLWDFLKARMERRAADPTATALAFVLALLAPLLAAAALLGPDDEVAATGLLFLGVLPLLNALADFASTGATRRFLRKGLEDDAWFWGLIDLSVGALIFLALAAALIWFVAAGAWLGTTRLIDLPLLFADAETNGSMRNDPGAYAWLFIAFGTTLLPTLAHFALALYSYVVTAPAFWRRRMADLIRKGGEGSPRKAREGLLMLGLSVGIAAALAFSVIPYGLWWVAGTYGFHLLDGVLLLLEPWADLIGAIPPG